MASATTEPSGQPAPTADTVELRLSSPNGPITRRILKTPIRDATPSEIPIIDIYNIFSTDVHDRRAVAAEVAAASTSLGFFYVRNHGIPPAATARVHGSALSFFHQDADTKLRAHCNQSAYFNGYRPPRTQRINPSEGIDVRETFSWTYDPRHDPLIERDPATGDVAWDAIPPEARRLMRVEDFPWSHTDNLPDLKSAMTTYLGECLRVARALTRTFALSLGLDEDAFDDKVRWPDAAYALNWYPPLQQAAADPDKQVSVGSHTDFQLFTLLWQDAEGGLEVLSRQGQWLRAKPIPGTLVVNIADYMQRVTGGRYVSTVHRARNTGPRERISVAFFWGFGRHERCGVLREDGTMEGEVSCEEWVNARVRSMLQVKDEA